MNRKEKNVELGHQKGSCSIGGTCSFDHDTAKNLQGTGNRPRSAVIRDNSAERQDTRKTQEVHQERKIVFRVSIAKEDTVVRIEKVILGIHRIANISRKINVEWARIVHLFTRKRRSDLPFLHEREKGKHQNPTTKKHRSQQ